MEPRKFHNPDNILRPAPFWAINERVTPEETSRQMEDMISVGLSGGFFHSRHGLVTDYLSEEWFAGMDAAIKTARENDGYVWLYDEDLWPSGNAGGQIAGMKDEYRAALLIGVLVAAGEPLPALAEDEALRYCYIIKSREGLKLTDFELVPIENIDDYKSYERLFMVRRYTPKIGWWSGESYSNLLDPEAMREFTKLTHDVYYQKLGNEFGKRIPGIFTDEPQISYSSFGFAWYEGIPDVYKKWTDRDFVSDLPFMFFDGPQSRKIRLLIHRTILTQFLEAYSKPLFQWCEEHGIEHTGHYNAEDSFHGQIICHGGGIMAHYRYQQAPGIDHLCRQVGEGHCYGSGMLFTVKQVSSAARQLGRKRVLTEIFGVSRHTNTFEDFKWIGDYDLVLGANFFCPHLTWYSAKGRRKRDYPPSWNYQQTYWNDLKPLNDYFTRVAYALTCGKAKTDILVLHSIESATAARRLGVELRGHGDGRSQRLPVNAPTEDMHAAFHYDQLLRTTTEAILNAGHDCDFGDEGYIQDMGSVRGDTFNIGEMSYKVVVVPPSATWRPSTFDLLDKFAANGGKVIMLGELPTQLDCDDAADKWSAFKSRSNVMTIPCAVANIQDAVDEIAPRSFTLKGIDGRSYPSAYLQHRVDGDQEIFFIVNSDRADTRDFVLSCIDAGDKQITMWDAVEGVCEAVNACRSGSDLRYEFTLPPCGSILLTLGPGECSNVGKTKPAISRCGVKPLAREFDFTRLDPNVLVIDRISVSLDGGKTFEKEDLDWRVRHIIAGHFNTAAALEWQPWVAIRKKLFDGKGGPIVLRYTFESDLDKPRAFAVIEDIQKGALTVNGSPVDISDADWHWDRGFGKVDISAHIKKGVNVLDFAVEYDFLTEVEPVYIVGDFGVRLADPYRGKLIAEPAKLRAGSWTEQGYPFYAGRMLYRASFGSASGGPTVLRLIKPSGTLYKVKVNGGDAGAIYWRPYDLDISGLVKQGDNEIEIEVISSLQNAWGPLHERIGDDNLWCGPNAFEDENILRDEFSIFPYGLLGGVEIAEG